MTGRQRMETVFAGLQPDHTPVLGGWIAWPDLIRQITGVSEEQYWADPVEVSIRAYRELGTDGLMGVFVPPRGGDFRVVDINSYAHAGTGEPLESALSRVDAMPSAAEIEAGFDFEAEYTRFAQSLRDGQARCEDMLWLPAQWGAAARISWYIPFGYQNFFIMVAAHQKHACKLLETGGAQARNTSRLVARAVREGLHPKAVLLGDDMCTQRGPMLSVQFMEEYYAPQLRYGFEPLLEVGCRPVWHCDGDPRLMLDMVIKCGVQGLQGFQPECGMTIDYVAKLRTREGEKLLIFGPMAVTTELPRLRPEEIKDRVRHAVDVCRDNAHLVLFTSNTINPDVPLENIRAMHEAAREG